MQLLSDKLPQLVNKRDVARSRSGEWGVGVCVIELSTLQTVMMRGIHLFWCQADNLEAVEAFPAPTVALTGWEPQTHPSTHIPRHISVVRAAHTNHPINSSHTLARLWGFWRNMSCSSDTCCLVGSFILQMSLLTFFFSFLHFYSINKMKKIKHLSVYILILKGHTYTCNSQKRKVS